MSILLARLAMNSKIKGKSIYRTLYFLPSVTMSAAVALLEMDVQRKNWYFE